MKILLISTENTLVCFGARMISAMLKRNGHSVELLFLPREFDDLESDADITEISRWVADRNADIIGFTLMSSHLRRTLRIHNAVRELIRAPIIWGGIHPTLRPEECIQFADAVCVGEGEYPMLEFVNVLSAGQTPRNIPNIWWRDASGIYRNPPRLRSGDLDALPWADHDPGTQWVRHAGTIQKMSPEAWRSYIPGFMDTHYVMSSRGCPHNCTYCCNSALRKVAEGPYLRRRSPEHFIGELVGIKAAFPELKGFVFMDDSFFYGNAAWFDRFCSLYKEKIDLPFYCWANPTAVTEDRIRWLADAGLVGVHVGFESGSERISEGIYRRGVPREVFLRCMDILHRHRKKIVDIRVDVITDNPYETEEDVATTVEVISRLKKPFFIGIVSLIFYPQTELIEMARKDGIVKESDADLYNREFFRYKPTYLNRLMRSTPMTPGWLIRFFIRARKSKPGRWLFYIYYFGYFVLIRRRLRALRRKVTLALLKRFGHKLSARKVVTTRVALIDF